MFGLFKKDKAKVAQILDFVSIGLDMHSHVLPGIDDGAKTIEDSIVLIKQLMGLGIKKIVATPHIMSDYYRNTPQTIQNALYTLKAALAEQQIDIKLEAAAEYFFEEGFMALIEKDEVLSFGNNCVLFEFSFVSPPPVYIPYLQKLKDKGYQPILAHPERYPYFTPEQYKNLKDWGIWFQLNTISLTGYYSPATRKIAEMLVDNGMIDLISSDMHHIRHADALRHSLEMPYLQKLLADNTLKNNLLL